MRSSSSISSLILPPAAVEPLYLMTDDSIAGVLKEFYLHPEGLDSPFTKETTGHIKDCKVFAEVTGKAGDTFILHPHLPHTNSPNHLRTPRVIINPHVTLKEPYDLDRADPSDYSLVERIILDRMGRDRIPKSEYHPLRPRIAYYPRNWQLRVLLVQEQLDRMIAHAKKNGKGPESLNSIWLHGGEELELFKKNFGLDLPLGPRHDVLTP